MKLTISRERTYIPEFNGNKNLPTTEQIVVKYKTPTVEIKSRCRSTPQSKAIADAKGKITSMEISVDRDNISTLTEMLLSIHGASYEDEKGNEVTIAAAKDLIKAPLEFEPLLHEIVKEFDRVLDETEINEKNSE